MPVKTPESSAERPVTSCEGYTRGAVLARRTGDLSAIHDEAGDRVTQPIGLSGMPGPLYGITINITGIPVTQRGFPVTQTLAPIRHPHTECIHPNTKVARAACRRARAREWETITRAQLNGRVGFDVKVHTVDGVISGTLLGWGSRALAVRDRDNVRVRVPSPSLLAVEIKREMNVDDL